MQEGPRLAATAFPAQGGDCGFGMVRAHEDAREPNSMGGVAAHDFRVHGVHLLAGQKAAREAGLVRDDEEGRALPLERAQALRRAGRKPHLSWISEEAALDDERSVAIEEEGVEPSPRQEPGASALRTASPKDLSV